MKSRKIFDSKYLFAGGLILLMALSGCGGSDGKDGADGAPGMDGTDGNTPIEMAKAVDPEQCIICHETQGQAHQDIYNDYSDASTLGLTIDSVVSVADGSGGFDATMTLSITKDGMPYLDADGLPMLDQKRYYVTGYDSATRTFASASNKSFSNPVSLGGGQYSVTATGLSYQPESSNAEVYAYIAQGKLDTEGMTLYGDVANAGMAFGDAGSYESTANVSACETCHGKPYMKHGYRAAEVDGLADFAACKNCHLDDKSGSHIDWQILVDNPVRYAELHDGDSTTTAEKAKYAYNRTIMNDVHMSHAMEFPYPQSMKNCNTCHAGKLDQVLTDENFVISTCKSCHAVDGGVNATGTVDTTEYALNVMAQAKVAQHMLLDTATDADDCAACHKTGGGGLQVAPSFSQIHNGYDSEIYTADGTRYADAFTVALDDAGASIDANKVTFSFTATENTDIAGLAVTDIEPSILVGLYGYDTKDFIVYTHGRTIDSDRDLEWTFGNVGDSNSRFESVSMVGGTWTVSVDLSTWSDKIDSGAIKRIELAVRPALKDASGTTVAVNAPSRTFDLAAGAYDDTFYADIVNVADGCNTCHDALATSFHSADRGGNIKVCRMCHATLSGGSHLELQSRSIDSYVHAVHSFAPFDPADVDMTDPVEAAQFDLHKEHTFPNFTIKNCQACHNPGMFNPPGQGKSLPGILSASDEVVGRTLGNIASVVTGPGARACGACHRTHALNEANDNKLIAVNAHTKLHGYAVADEDGVIDEIIARIMSMFN